MPSNLRRPIAVFGPSVLAIVLAGCSSADFAVSPTLLSAQLDIDSQAPEALADIEFEIELQSGRNADRCIDAQISLQRESDPGEEIILELEANADFDACFNGAERRILTLTNVEMTNADLSVLCEGDEPWDATMYTQVEDDEKTGWGLTSTLGLSLSCS